MQPKSNTMNLKGKVKLVKDLEVISDKFKKREFVIETEDKYPQMVIFQTVNDRTSICDSIKDGDIINVEFNIRGKSYNGKFFVSLEAWKVNADKEAVSSDGLPF